MIDPNYTPEKLIFTDADLENLCFHDCRIFAMTPEGDDLVMDIDYMFEWIEPEEGETGFTHPISPCTLHFKNVEDMGMFFEGTYPDVSFIMQDCYEEENAFSPEQHTYKIECLGGNFILRCDGFEMIVRKQPMFVKNQCLSMDQRGGINFSKEPYTTK